MVTAGRPLRTVAMPYSNAGDKPWQTAALSEIRTSISERAAAIC